jgi:hypothetical protein
VILLVTLLPPLLIGYLAVRALTPKWTPAWAGTLLHVFLGAGCGVGLLSLLYFTVRITIGPSLPAIWSGEVILLAAAAYACWRRTEADPEVGQLTRAGTWLLSLLFLAILCTHTASYLHVAQATPLGEWDAWAIWNLRAKFLAQQDATWVGAWSPFLRDLPGNFGTHPDYPLLLSGFIARSWALTHSIAGVTVPIAVCALFWTATVAVLVAALAVLRSWTMAMIGGLILLSNAAIALNAPTQYSDIPLSFFILSTFVLLLLVDARRDAPAYTIALAGFTMGCAAWTKDEGILFAAVTGVAMLSCTLLARLPARHFALFASGASLPLSAILYFKVFLATGPGSWGPLTLTSALRQLAEPARYTQILQAFWNETAAMGRGIAHPGIALILLAALLGISRSQLRSPLTRTALGVCAVMLAGQFGVYVVTPFDLSWHLGTSLGRVLTQLAPGLTFLLVACCRTPEETAPPAVATPPPIRAKRKKR